MSIEATSRCPCGAEIKFKLKRPKALAQSSAKLKCDGCASEFLATVKRKGAEASVSFQIIDLTEKACRRLRGEVAGGPEKA